jgi:uncharacterized protein (DUF3820 family)
MCDYLASRKNLEYIFDEAEVRVESVVEPPKQETRIVMNVDEYWFPFGKYNGLLVKDIAKTDIKYVRWFSECSGLDSRLKQYLEELINK